MQTATTPAEVPAAKWSQYAQIIAVQTSVCEPGSIDRVNRSTV